MRITGKKGKIDPSSIANLWYHSRPKDENRTNSMEMYVFVGSVSDKQANLVALIDPNSKTADLVVYNKPISENLIFKKHENLKDATAFITKNPRRMQCSFVMEEEESSFTGYILFGVPPSYYDEKDKFVLFSVLQHELRHAMDFVDNNNNPIKNDYLFPKSSPGDYEIDIDLYSRNISEVRAHADQAQTILKLLGRKLAKDAIKTSRLSLADNEMREAMLILIDVIADNANINENNVIEPPAVVIKSEDYDVRKLENHLIKILELSKFSNFIKTK